MTEPTVVRVVYSPRPEPPVVRAVDGSAHAYRLKQAATLLRDAGCIEQPDGTWLLPGQEGAR